MHELSIVQALIDQVRAEAQARNARAVHAVVVGLGELSGVDPELLKLAFETFRTGSVCAEASLAIRRVPARWECPRCGGSPRAGGPLSCEKCHLPARLTAGDEILLERLELEVSDVS